MVRVGFRLSLEWDRSGFEGGVGVGLEAGFRVGLE